MKTVARSLAAVAVAGMVGGQAFGQGAPVVVRDAPIHKVPAEAEAPPAEPLAPPNTLNAQFAALQSPAPAPVQAPAPAAAAQSRDDGPSVALAPSLIDAAGAFEAYMRRAAAIDARFADGGAIAKAVSTGAGYEIDQFQEGMVAYAALAALQEADFVQAVYDLGRDRSERDALAEALLADPKAVMGVDGADAAAGAVSGVLSTMGAELVRAGQGVRKAAYDVQKQAWSKEAAPDPQKRLADAKQISATRAAMTPEDTQALIATIVALRKAGPAVGGRAPAPTPVVQRGLALAALAVLGRAGEEDADKLAPLLDDAKSADCMKMAKLNLYQCMAVAGPHYEHAFCLGQHALMDTGQCVVSAAGQSPIPAGAPVQGRSRSISVPIALISPAGPERARAYARPPAGAASAPTEERPAASADVRPPAVASEERSRDDAPAPRQAALEDTYDRARGDERDDDGYRAPPRPRRQARDDRYYEDEARYDGWRDRQDYDPYAEGPPAYAYRYGR